MIKAITSTCDVLAVKTPHEIECEKYMSSRRIDHTVTYSTFRNNHICFNFQISFYRAVAVNACSMYLEPRERVWWLQMSFSPFTLGEANIGPQIPSLDLRGHFTARESGEREGIRGKTRKINCCYTGLPTMLYGCKHVCAVSRIDRSVLLLRVCA